MKKTLLCAVAVFGGLCVHPFARADWLTSTLGEPVAEVSHSVDIRVRDGVATYKVQRVFGNRGERPDEAVVGIELPEGAAATGLRIRARTQWYRGELLESEMAARRYEELTGMGAFELQDPALLRWQGPSSLTLQVFPVPAGGANTVEYTLTAPLHYSQGMYWLDYLTGDGDDSGVSAPVVRIHPGFGDARTEVRVAGVPVAPGAPVVMREVAEDEGPHAIAIAPGPIDVVAARLGRVVASTASQFARFEIDAAPELQPLPVKPVVTFVIDASFSVGDDGVPAQLDLARAYLAHVPDARVEVIVVRRTAERLFGTFLAASRFDAAIERAQAAGRLELANGSHLDQGLALAAKALRGQRGATRIVAFTDDGLRAAFSLERTVAAVRRAPAGTIAHIVSASGGGSPSESRDDAHRLAPIAHATGGIYADVSTGDRGDGELAAVALGLVRPTRIDHFAVDGLPGGEDDDDRPDSLAEGEGYRFFQRVARAPKRVVVRGQLWSRPFRRVVTTTRGFDRASAAWVFSNDIYESLDEVEMMKVARAGRAVSPVTSYLAIEPGVRPSREGIDRDAFGSIGAAYGVGMGRMGIGHGGGGLAQRPNLAHALRRAVAECIVEHEPAAGWRLVITLETTGTEIVDVAPMGTSAFAQCAREGIWATELTGAFAPGHAVHSLSLSAKDF